MALLQHPEKVGIYAEPQGDRNTHNSNPATQLEALDALGFRWYYTYANGAEPYDVSLGFDNRGTLTDPGYTPTIVQYRSGIPMPPTRTQRLWAWPRALGG
jgi:hypothetical protein